MKITITGTTEQANYQNEFYKPFICRADSKLPKCYNRGYNTYAFTENVELVFVDMPNQVKDNYKPSEFKFYSTNIEVIDPSGRKVGMQYYMTEKNGIKIEEGYAI